MIGSGSAIALHVERPAAGGRMLARHDGRVVLVWGAIPGERVAARVERVQKGVAYAQTVEVLEASPDRRAPAGDWRCGGNVYAHVTYARQLALKSEIVRDALARIGRLPLADAPQMVASPDSGYRMRARLHVERGRIGFFREGTHELCAPGAAGQLLPETVEWLAGVERRLGAAGLAGIASFEIAENVAATERACHLELRGRVDVNALAALSLAPGLTGLSASRRERPGADTLSGSPAVTDVLRVGAGASPATVRLRRNVRAFFQGNRFLLEPLANHVVTLVPPGPVADLYAGVGLFGLSLAAAGAGDITLVEGDPVAAADLRRNAEALDERVRVRREAVEAWLAARAPTRAAAPSTTYIVDPPRTGLSRASVAGIIRHRPARIVYVSCDPATLARDARGLVDAGYDLEGVTGFDLFPNTAHVESVAVLTRPRATARPAVSAGGPL